VQSLLQLGIVYSECVFIALGIQRAMRMRHNVICGLPRSTIFFHIISQKAQFKKKVFNINFVFRCFLRLFSETFFILKRTERDISKTYNGLHVKHRLYLSDFNETWIFSTYFEKYSNIKFHENPSSGSRVVPCGQTDVGTDGHDEASSRFPQFCELTQKFGQKIMCCNINLDINSEMC
jgi:hypothetical protein